MFKSAGFVLFIGCVCLSFVINAQDSTRLHYDYENIESIILDEDNLSGYLVQLKEDLYHAREENNTFKIAEKSLFLGRIFVSLNSPDNALDYSLDALDYFSKTTDTTYKLYSLKLLAGLYGSINEPAISVEYSKQVLELGEIIKDTSSIEVACINLGLRYYDLGKLNEAKIFLLKAEHLLQLVKNNNSLTYLYNNWGIFYVKTNIDSSYYYFKKSLNTIENKETNSITALVYSNISHMAYQRGAYTEAYNNALLALDYYKIENMRGDISNTYGTLINTLIKLNEYDKAIEYMDESIVAKQEIYTRRKSEDAAKLKIVYETNELLAKNKILNTENILKEEQIAKIRLKFIFTLIIILLSVFVISFFIIQNIKLKKSYKQIVKESVKTIKIEHENVILKEKINGDRTVTKSAENSIGTENEDIYEKIIELLENKKLYTNPNFNLRTLAKELKKNRVYISQAINKAGNKSFADLINEYRTKEAKILLCSGNIKSITIEAIGNESGFNSKSTFFRVFKEQTGVTPSFFSKNIDN